MGTLRNEANRVSLIDRVNNLSGNESAIWGKMNVNQMLSHLVQAGELPFVHDLPNASNFMSRTLIKPLVLYVLPMPKEVKTSPEMNQQENGRKPLEFDEDKRLLIESIGRLANLSIDHKCLDHPFFGPMNAKEWGDHRSQTHRSSFEAIRMLGIFE